jgi:hypothetical protein
LKNDGSGVLSWSTQAAALPNPIAQDALFTDATYDIGKTGATRPRDFFLSRNATIGGTLNVTGILTLSSTDNSVGTITTGVWHGTAIGDTYLAALNANKLSGTITSAVQDNITRLGTITSGVWNAGAVTTSGKLMVNYSGPTIELKDAAATPNRWWLLSGRTDGNDGIVGFYDARQTAWRFSINTAGVVVIDQLASGNLTSASGVITSSSDERLKDIAGPLTYGLAEVRQLRPIRFHWNAQSGIPTEPEYGGFGAEQVEASMPLAVSYGPDGVRGLNDRVILGAVVNATQELDTRVAALEARLAIVRPSATPIGAAKIALEIAARKAADASVYAKRITIKSAPVGGVQ